MVNPHWLIGQLTGLYLLILLLGILLPHYDAYSLGNYLQSALELDNTRYRGYFGLPCIQAQMVSFVVLACGRDLSDMFTESTTVVITCPMYWKGLGSGTLVWCPPVRYAAGSFPSWIIKKPCRISMQGHGQVVGIVSIERNDCAGVTENGVTLIPLTSVKFWKRTRIFTWKRLRYRWS